jgi:hypothetical protein
MASLSDDAHLQPGWRWSTSVKPLVKTARCEGTHLQYHVSGEIDRGRRLFFLLTSWTLWEEHLGHVTLSALFSAIWFSFNPYWHTLKSDFVSAKSEKLI